MSVYPGFSTQRMDEIFGLSSRVRGNGAVEAAVARAQGAAGDIPGDAADAIVAACGEPVDVEILSAGWQVGTPVLGLLDALRSRLPESAREHLHRGLTTQDVIDTATMVLVHDALQASRTTSLAALARVDARDHSTFGQHRNAGTFLLAARRHDHRRFPHGALAGTARPRPETTSEAWTCRRSSEA